MFGNISSVYEAATASSSSIAVYMDQTQQQEDDYGAGGTSCTQGPALLDQPQIRVAVICAYLLVFLVCLLGNMFTIIVICVHSSMRTATNFFLANLAFADLLVAVFCILQNMFHVVGSSSAHWPLGAVVCKLYVLVLHLVPCTGIGILVCVSLEKYIAVLHPLLALKLLTPKLRLCMALTIWGVSLVCNLPYYFTTRQLTYGALSACVRDMREDSSLTTKHIISISFVVWYCIPLTSIAFLYTRIGMVLWNGRLKPVLCTRISSDSPTNGNTLVAAAPITCSSCLNSSSPNGGGKVHEAVVNNTPVPTIAVSNTTSTDLLESRKKIIRLLIAIVCSFATLTLPHHARLLYVMSLLWAPQTFHSNNESNSFFAKNLQFFNDEEEVNENNSDVNVEMARYMQIMCSQTDDDPLVFWQMWIENDTCTSSWSALLQPTTYLSLFLSSSVNPFLYAFMSQRFREAVRDIVKCRTGKTQRKYTRTRTLLSDCALSSRSPSLTRLHNGHTSSLSIRKNNSSNFLSNFLYVHNEHLHSGSHLTLHNDGSRVKTRLIRSESGEPLTNCSKNTVNVRCVSGDSKKEKKVCKSLYRNTRI